MSPFVTLIILAFIATVVALATGIGSMAHGGEFDQKHDVQLMAVRVGLQGAAIVLVLLAVYVISV